MKGQSKSRQYVANLSYLR